MEDEFRFGHTVVKVGDGYRMGGSIKGGSSSIWVMVQEAALEAYVGWKQRESPPVLEDAEAYAEIKHIFSEAGVKFASYPAEYEPSHGSAYRVMLEITRSLPVEHLKALALKEVRAGGWGPDAAKASAYKSGTVYIYDFAMSGAARTLAGLYLHELGHAFHDSLAPAQARTLNECHEIIAGTGAFMGIEFLLDPESRIVYQEFIPDEFAAETYMLYVSCGSALRDFIRKQPFKISEAWWKVYLLYMESFDGAGYI